MLGAWIPRLYKRQLDEEECLQLGLNLNLRWQGWCFEWLGIGVLFVVQPVP